jgi:hypothetical protein
MNKTLVFICLLSLLGGVVLACLHWGGGIPAVEVANTDKLTGEIKDTLETVTARIREQDERTRTEVRVIHETVRARVNALPADSVADGLNAELALFRGMAGGAPGLDGD